MPFHILFHSPLQDYQQVKTCVRMHKRRIACISTGTDLSIVDNKVLSAGTQVHVHRSGRQGSKKEIYVLLVGQQDSEVVPT